MAGGFAAVLLIASVATAWTPLFAITIAIFAIAAIMAGFVFYSGAREAPAQDGSPGATARARSKGAVTESGTGGEQSAQADRDMAASGAPSPRRGG